MRVAEDGVLGHINLGEAAHYPLSAIISQGIMVDFSFRAIGNSDTGPNIFSYGVILNSNPAVPYYPYARKGVGGDGIAPKAYCTPRSYAYTSPAIAI